MLWSRPCRDSGPVAVQAGRSPAGTPLGMAPTDFVEEMSAVGERLLLKLQRLPQAEPVEIVAFSVIVLFTGQQGPEVVLGSSCHPEDMTTVPA